MHPEQCFFCGSSAIVTFGPDIRFDSGSKEYGWLAQCGSRDCSAPTYTRHSSDAAWDSWNKAMKGMRHVVELNAWGIELYLAAAPSPQEPKP